MHELFRDPFAHHTYQAFLNTLTGHPERNLNESAHNKKRKRHADKVVSVTTPESFTELHKRLLETLKGYEWSILENLVFDKYASPLLQSIIETDVPMKPKKKAKSKSGNKTLVEILLTGAGDPTGAAGWDSADYRATSIYNSSTSRYYRQSANGRDNTHGSRGNCAPAFYRYF